ncbi:hypothetical protein BKH43_05470 [Helicobacter sp. 13S00401-1]|uniref:hypothetical protein n=1 Tax=Helicobacter sp. 13S00401-1 TaxID=1905758 RepID=UPI000BA6CAA6|nr:hypothetical protein [Helicobacter sp. 13S00401-1]PAF50188.1 hypothetical protein BKH43_05470 [Helicobacter sp. 13S00401-1]
MRAYIYTFVVGLFAFVIGVVISKMGHPTYGLVVGIVGSVLSISSLMVVCFRLVCDVPIGICCKQSRFGRKHHSFYGYFLTFVVGLCMVLVGASLHEREIDSLATY